MLIVDTPPRDDSDAESDDRDDRGDQSELLVSESARCRDGIDLRDTELRVEDMLLVELERESSLRSGVGFPGTTSGERDDDEGQETDDTQLGSSS